MNLIVCFAVLLTIAQAPVPATGKTPYDSGGNSQTQNSNAHGSEQPRLPTVAPSTEQGNGPTPKDTSSEHTSNDDQASINITNPTPVPVAWGWKEWTAWGANLTLVLVGMGGIVVAVCTLRKIERQTKAAEDATKVAKENMAALINKERARLRVNLPRNDLDFLKPGYTPKEKPELAPYRGETHPIEISVFNRGATTARDVKGSFSIEIYPVSIEDSPGPKETLKVDIGDLAPSTEPFKQSVALYGGIHQKDLDAIHKQRAVLRVSGEITYTDAFEAQKTRSTEFSFEWKSDAEWHESRSIRAVSADSSDWYAYPPDANKTT
jgi:hypothetical protein